jgi:hypothetical protein
VLTTHHCSSSAGLRVGRRGAVPPPPLFAGIGSVDLERDFVNPGYSSCIIMTVYIFAYF